MSTKQSWKRGAIRSFALYSIDMAAAITGWVYGFGMTVKNWWVIIGCMLVVRWVFHVAAQAHYLSNAKQIAKESNDE